MKLLCPGFQAESKKYSDELYQPPTDLLSKNDSNLTNEIRKELDQAFESIQEILIAFRADSGRILEDMFKIKG